MICPYYAEFRLASWLSVFYYAKTQIGSITLQNAKVVGISNNKNGLKICHCTKRQVRSTEERFHDQSREKFCFKWGGVKLT